jgi:hypothetical protein
MRRDEISARATARAVEIAQERARRLHNERVEVERALGDLETRERMLFERHTDSIASCASLSTADRQGARFYLEAVRGLPTVP